MKIRNGWNTYTKQWDKLNIKLRISFIDILAIEVDISRDFYLFTILNFTIKNR
jgi:hypothetical protein